MKAMIKCPTCQSYLINNPDNTDILKCPSCNFRTFAKEKITLQELNKNNRPINEEIDKNLKVLHYKINMIRALWRKPMVVTSGLRSQEDQERINPSAPKSKHLIGAACDISDRDGELNEWCKNNEDVMVALDLYLENRRGPWQHFQIYPPKSGKRWFNP